MGHITSLMKIFDDYDRIIIGITSDSPNVLSLKSRKKIFKSVLSGLINLNMFSSTPQLNNIKDTSTLPKFDVCVTGNQSVVDFMEKNNFKQDY